MLLDAEFPWDPHDEGGDNSDGDNAVGDNPVADIPGGDNLEVHRNAQVGKHVGRTATCRDVIMKLRCLQQKTKPPECYM